MKLVKVKYKNIGFIALISLPVIIAVMYIISNLYNKPWNYARDFGNINDSSKKSVAMNTDNIIYVEQKLYNWQDIFNYFMLNNGASYQVNCNIDSNMLETKNGIVVFKKPKFIFSRGRADEIVEKYGQSIIEQCNEYKLDWRLILAIVHQESFFNENAISRAGAFGLMQLMPRTGSGLQSQLNLEDTKSPLNNLTAGIYYYASLVSSFTDYGNDKYQFALVAYNAGLGRIIDAMTISAYMGKEYKYWENVKDYLPMLSSQSDSIQALVWPQSKRPPGGVLNNWKEPYLYVEYIMYYWEEYKKIYKGNLPDELKERKSKKKKKK